MKNTRTVRVLACVSTCVALLVSSPSRAATCTWTGLAGNSYWSSSNNWSGNIVPGLSDDVVFDSGSSNAVLTNALTIKSLTVTNTYSGTNTQNADLTISGDFKLYSGLWRFTAGTAATLTVGGDLYVNTTVQCQRVSIAGFGTGRVFTVTSNMTIGAQGTLDGLGMGFDPGPYSDTPSAEAGPGQGFRAGNGGPYSGSGAGHGGEGGRSLNDPLYPRPGGKPYGSITQPTSLGSGGGWGHYTPMAYGGGAIRLNVAGDVTVDGLITFNGRGYPDRGVVTWESDGGAAGGSVWISCSNLAGGGTIRANGGSGQLNGYPAGGGGGRIALYYSGSAFSGIVSAYGGDAANHPPDRGAAGTLYTKKASDINGTLIIDNSNQVTGASTLIGTSVTDTVVGNILIRNGGILRVFTNQTLTVNGWWTNSGTFWADTGSTLLLASTNTASLGGSTAFQNLTCTNAGKRIDIRAGDTFIVSNVLTLTGASGQLIDINSTATSNWFLKLSPLTHSIRYVDVEYSDARPGASAEAFTSVDSGNNSNWTFAVVGETNTWTGAVDTDWAKGGNWDKGRTTVYTDVARIPTGLSVYPRLDFSRNLTGLIIESGASANLNGKNLNVTNRTTMAGTLGATGAETLWFGGDVDMTGGTFTQAQSTVSLNGQSAQSITFGSASFNALTIDNTSAAVTFNDAVRATNLTNNGGSLLFLGNVSVGQRLQTDSGAVTFRGNLSVSDVLHTGGALAVSGTVTTASFRTGVGDVTFGGNLTATDYRCVQPGVTMTFHAASTYSITNLQLHGSSTSKIVLKSSSPGSYWNLRVPTWSSVVYADAQDSDASSGMEIVPLLSTNSGHNLNWNFGSSTNWRVWTGAGSGEFTNSGNWSPAGIPDTNSLLLVDGLGVNTPVLSGAATVLQVVVGGPTSAQLTVNQPLTVLSNMTVLTNGMVTHSANSTTTVSRLTINVGGTLMNRGAIDVTGKGFRGAFNVDPGNGYGPGGGYRGGSGGPYYGAGAGHGGEGGHSSSGAFYGPGGTAYGSLTQPTTLGSGGGAGHYDPQSDWGGGMINLNVTGDLVNVGSIVSDGAPGQGAGVNGIYSGGGSGGSVLIACSNLTGSGTIRANGGLANQAGGGGGGGRVGVYYSGLTLSGPIAAYGGRAYSGGTPYGDWSGAAGTVYLKASSSALGTLIVDNNGFATTAATQISSNVTDAVVGNVLIQNAGKLRILTNQTLTVQGNWNNSGTFVADTNSTVVFASLNDSTITGSNTFYNLACTNVAKTIFFEAGRTNVVMGTLSLRRPSLQSTISGQWWYLRLDAAASQDVSRVSVQDGNATGGPVIVAPSSESLGNNVNWTIRAPEGTLITLH